jgi:Zn-finger nucleic acid-binding protein
MEQIEYAGIEIDRCTTCHGIWFDAGEVDLLRNEKAAAAIDIGDAREGREKNIIDHYRCPRCSGGMVRRIDPQQHHIWYETCSSCSGSFFDAGEFVDLSKFTIADFFKGLSTPERT